jgi:hypothetical protein
VKQETSIRRCQTLLAAGEGTVCAQVEKRMQLGMSVTGVKVCLVLMERRENVSKKKENGLGNQWSVQQ